MVLLRNLSAMTVTPAHLISWDKGSRLEKVKGAVKNANFSMLVLQVVFRSKSACAFAGQAVFALQAPCKQS